MFALMSSPTIMMSTQQRFKKFGKETRERRKSELDKIGDAFKGIADDEKKRAKKLFEEHRLLQQRSLYFYHHFHYPR